MRVVLDTNVLVSALLSPAGAPARILDLVFAGLLIPLYDDRIFLEYREVLARPRLRIPPADRAAVLDFFIEAGRLVGPVPLGIDLADPDDAAFVEVAVASGAEALITGNLRHFSGLPADIGVRMIAPAEFLIHWHQRAR